MGCLNIKYRERTNLGMCTKSGVESKYKKIIKKKEATKRSLAPKKFSGNVLIGKGFTERLRSVFVVSREPVTYD